MNGERRKTADIDPAEARELFIRSVKRLMLAVLEDAMQCYQAHADGRGRSQAEAEAWLRDRGAEGPFAFETICQTLKIDPDCLRQGLRQRRLRQLLNDVAPTVSERAFSYRARGGDECIGGLGPQGGDGAERLHGGFPIAPGLPTAASRSPFGLK